jgi:hypothetical protein
MDVERAMEFILEQQAQFANQFAKIDAALLELVVSITNRGSSLLVSLFVDLLEKAAERTSSLRRA